MGEAATLTATRASGRRPVAGTGQPDHAQSAPQTPDDIARAPRALDRLSAGAAGRNPGEPGRWAVSELQVDHDDVLALQRAAGNGAVAQLITATAARRRRPGTDAGAGAGDAAGEATQAGANDAAAPASGPAPAAASGPDGRLAPAAAPFGSLPAADTADLKPTLDRAAGRDGTSTAVPPPAPVAPPRGKDHAPPVPLRARTPAALPKPDAAAMEPPAGDALDGAGGGGGQPALAGAAAGAPPLLPSFTLPPDPENAKVGAAIVDAGIAGILSLSAAAGEGLAQVESAVGEQQAGIDEAAAAQSRAVSGAVGGARARVTAKVAQATAQLQQVGAGEHTRLSASFATAQTRAAEVAAAAETRMRDTGTRRGDEAVTTANAAGDDARSQIEGGAAEARTAGRTRGASAHGQTTQGVQAQREAARQVAEDTASQITHSLAETIAQLRGVGPEARTEFVRQANEIAAQLGTQLRPIQQQLTLTHDQAATTIDQSLTMGASSINQLGQSVVTGLNALEGSVRQAIRGQARAGKQSVALAGTQATASIRAQQEAAAAAGASMIGSLLLTVGTSRRKPAQASALAQLMGAQLGAGFSSTEARARSGIADVVASFAIAATTTNEAMQQAAQQAISAAGRQAGSGSASITQQQAQLIQQLLDMTTAAITSGTTVVSSADTSINRSIDDIDTRFGQAITQLHDQLAGRVRDQVSSAREPMGTLNTRIGQAMARAEERANESWLERQWDDAVESINWGFVAGLIVGLLVTILVIALLGTGIGALILAGALAGALSVAASTLTEDAIHNRPTDWGRLGRDMVIGAAIGAIGGAVGGGVAGALGTAVERQLITAVTEVAINKLAGVVVGTVSGIVQNEINGQPWDHGLLMNVAVGVATTYGPGGRAMEHLTNSARASAVDRGMAYNVTPTEFRQSMGRMEARAGVEPGGGAGGTGGTHGGAGGEAGGGGTSGTGGIDVRGTIDSAVAGPVAPAEGPGSTAAAPGGPAPEPTTAPAPAGGPAPTVTVEPGPAAGGGGRGGPAPEPAGPRGGAGAEPTPPAATMGPEPSRAAGAPEPGPSAAGALEAGPSAAGAPEPGPSVPGGPEAGPSAAGAPEPGPSVPGGPEAGPSATAETPTSTEPAGGGREGGTTPEGPGTTREGGPAEGGAPEPGGEAAASERSTSDPATDSSLPEAATDPNAAPAERPGAEATPAEAPQGPTEGAQTPAEPPGGGHEVVDPREAAARRMLDPESAHPTGPLSPDVMESMFGMPRRNQEAFQAVAERHGVEIDVRPTTREAPTRLAEGAAPKPEAIKAKSISDADVLLGARPEDVGLVGYFEPQVPERPAGMSQADWERIQPTVERRYVERMNEYHALAEGMAELGLPPGERAAGHDYGGLRVEVDEHGVVRQVGGEGEMGTPFTGDHDVFDIRMADGSPVPDRLYDQIVAEMRQAGMGVEHGAHMRWRPTSPHALDIFNRIVGRHMAGGEPLIRFGPGETPHTTFAGEGGSPIRTGRTGGGEGGAAPIVEGSVGAPREGGTVEGAPGTPREGSTTRPTEAGPTEAGPTEAGTPGREGGAAGPTREGGAAGTAHEGAPAPGAAESRPVAGPGTAEAHTYTPEELAAQPRSLTAEQHAAIDARQAQVREAILERLQGLDSGRTSGPDFEKFRRVIDALTAEPTPANQRVTEHAQLVWDALHNPQLIADVVSRLYGESLRAEAPAGFDPVTHAAMREAALGGPVHEIPPGVIPGDAQFFDTWVASGRRFLDIGIGAEHGATAHIIQDLVVDAAFQRAGIEMTSSQFREALGGVELTGPGPNAPGMRLWQDMYDSFNSVMTPEILTPALRTIPGLEGLQ